MEPRKLTEEQKEKVRAAKTAEELVEIAREEGVELTDDELEAISGGREWYSAGSVGEDNYMWT